LYPAPVVFPEICGILERNSGRQAVASWRDWIQVNEYKEVDQYGGKKV